MTATVSVNVSVNATATASVNTTATAEQGNAPRVLSSPSMGERRSVIAASGTVSAIARTGRANESANGSETETETGNGTETGNETGTEGIKGGGLNARRTVPAINMTASRRRQAKRKSPESLSHP